MKGVQKLFNLQSRFPMTDFQEKCVNQLSKGLQSNTRYQILKGITGTGKTLMMANIIQNQDKPVLVITQNKTLVAQLYNEFKTLFPSDHVGYYVSYYDKYLPEIYKESTREYFSKQTKVNDQISMLRNEAINYAINHRNTIIVASVSALWGIGPEEEYLRYSYTLTRGEIFDVQRLLNMNYRESTDLRSATYARLAPNIIEIIPSNKSLNGLKLFLNEEGKIERIIEEDLKTQTQLNDIKTITLYPANLNNFNRDELRRITEDMRAESISHSKFLKSQGKREASARIRERVELDIDMLNECGYCSGIENYSSILQNDVGNHKVYTIFDYFQESPLVFIDESHITLPQLRSQGASDSARKRSLISNGFRLPSSLESRPLTYEEFESKYSNIIYVSATPGTFELRQTRTCDIVEQVIRPTYIIEPEVTVYKKDNQIDIAIEEIRKVTEHGGKIFVTTFTKAQASDITSFFNDIGIKAGYLNSEDKTLDRNAFIDKLNTNSMDVLVGVNLLREGISVPKCELVIIFDADYTGFLRSEKSLIQYIGRAARNINGRVIMFADREVDDIKNAISETNRRRKIQLDYNKKHNITPYNAENASSSNRINIAESLVKSSLSGQDRKTIYKKMLKAAEEYNFELAAECRDYLKLLETESA